MTTIDAIGFDADDTLWHTELSYETAKATYVELLAPYAAAETINDKLYEREIANLATYGYGTKAFTLSMVETALELSAGEIPAATIGRLLELGREMMTADVETLDHVHTALEALSRDHELVVITKGDLLEQESKLARSGLAPYFRHFDVVSNKTVDVYAELLDRYDYAPERFVMVGNSLKSDVLPVLALGGYGVYVPYELTWAHETVDAPPTDRCRYFEVETLHELPTLIAELANRAPCE